MITSIYKSGEEPNLIYNFWLLIRELEYTIQYYPNHQLVALMGSNNVLTIFSIFSIKENSENWVKEFSENNFPIELKEYSERIIKLQAFI